MAGELAKKIREKYPNAYKNMNDDELEAQMIKKYPQYATMTKPTKGEVIDKHGNIHKPDGTVVHSSFKGKERVDRRFLDTDKMRSSMINFASKTPFPNVVGGFGDLAIQGLEMFNDPEAVAGGPLIKRGLNKINPKVVPQPRPNVEIPNATAASMAGSREIIPVKAETSILPTRTKANEIVAEAKGNTRHNTSQQLADNISNSPNRTGTMKTDDLLNLEDDTILSSVEKDRLDLLKKDIAKNGIKTPIELTVSRNNDGPWKGKYVLDEGHHRLAAAKDLGITDIPVKIIGNRKSSIIRPEAPRIRTNDPSAGRDIMAQVAAMPKKMPQVDSISSSIAKSPTPATSAVNKTDELGFVRKTVSEARALQTSMDLSAPLRQGVTQIHTKEFWKNLKPMFDAARSEEGFKKLSDEIEGRDTYRLMQRAGVEFTDVSKALAKREESMRGTLVEKYIPGVRASNRAYTLFLNKLRADTFDRMAKNTNLLDDVVDDTDEVSKGAKTIAKFVNDATGRGSLGSWEKSAVALNDVFFSPKLIASRVNMLGRAGKATFESISRTSADDAISKALRKEALKSMIGYGTLGTMSANISIMGGAEGTEDPKSTDFGKLKIGNTRIDMTGGFQQYFRVASQLSTNLATAISEENDLDIPSFLQNEQNAGDTAWRFLRNKLSPSVASLVDLLQGENVIGEEVSRSPKGVGKEILELVTPLIIDDLIELIREDPKMLPAILPAFFGAGIQSYGAINRTRGNRNNMPSIEMPQMPSISN